MKICISMPIQIPSLLSVPWILNLTTLMKYLRIALTSDLSQAWPSQSSHHQVVNNYKLHSLHPGSWCFHLDLIYSGVNCISYHVMQMVSTWDHHLDPMDSRVSGSVKMQSTAQGNSTLDENSDCCWLWPTVVSCYECIYCASLVLLKCALR